MGIDIEKNALLFSFTPALTLILVDGKQIEMVRMTTFESFPLEMCRRGVRFPLNIDQYTGIYNLGSNSSSYRSILYGTYIENMNLEVLMYCMCAEKLGIKDGAPVREDVSGFVKICFST